MALLVPPAGVAPGTGGGAAGGGPGGGRILLAHEGQWIVSPNGPGRRRSTGRRKQQPTPKRRSEGCMGLCWRQIVFSSIESNPKGRQENNKSSEAISCRQGPAVCFLLSSGSILRSTRGRTGSLTTGVVGKGRFGCAGTAEKVTSLSRPFGCMGRLETPAAAGFAGSLPLPP